MHTQRSHHNYASCDSQNKKNYRASAKDPDNKYEFTYRPCTPKVCGTTGEASSVSCDHTHHCMHDNYSHSKVVVLEYIQYVYISTCNIQSCL